MLPFATELFGFSCPSKGSLPVLLKQLCLCLFFKYFAVFSLINFSISRLTLRFSIHFELIFVKVRNMNLVSSFCLWTPTLPPPSLEEAVSSFLYFCHLCQTLGGCVLGLLFCVAYTLHHWMVCLLYTISQQVFLNVHFLFICVTWSIP